jgi:hypothetical protein
MALQASILHYLKHKTPEETKKEILGFYDRVLRHDPNGHIIFDKLDDTTNCLNTAYAILATFEKICPDKLILLKGSTDVQNILFDATDKIMCIRYYHTFKPKGAVGHALIVVKLDNKYMILQSSQGDYTLQQYLATNNVYKTKHWIRAKLMVEWLSYFTTSMKHLHLNFSSRIEAEYIVLSQDDKKKLTGYFTTKIRASL